jgi:CDP-4-dehydro-6-deoxyglucose reductase, E3
MAGTPYDATLERVVEHRPVTRSLFLRLPADRPLAFTPGQFVSLEVAAADGGTLVRAYSIASSPREPHVIELVVDRVPGGAVSEHLFSLVPGAALRLKAPFGTFTLGDPPAAEMVFVADATAIAPIRPMLARLAELRLTRPISVLHGGRGEDELLFRDEIVALRSSLPGLRYEAVLTDAGRVVGDNPELEARVLRRFIADDADRTRHFWLCAVGDLVCRLRDALRGGGYERRAVRYEQW